VGKPKRNDASRKKVSELITQYKLHPEFRDIYVEGSWDKNHIDWFLKASGITDVIIYDIDGVFIPPEMLAKHGFTEAQDGKKERVVTLAYELQEHIQVDGQVTCIADRDYDYLLGFNHMSPLLLSTDFSCQEMYFLAEPVFDKFLKVVVGCSVPAAKLLENLHELLQELHLFRATNLSLKWGMKWLPPERSCQMNGHVLELDTNDFIERYLSKGAKLGEKAEFLAEYQRLKAKLGHNPLHHCSKDDLFTLLSEILPLYCKEKALHEAEYIARALAGCAEHQHIAAHPLYRTLIDRFKKPE